ncbi:G5 domain-containing protein [Candidatus Saccharibacteria bacterium]|nr:G5 domain-containing protein [Candidatus Saccharibacteria bacterium]
MHWLSNLKHSQKVFVTIAAVMTLILLFVIFFFEIKNNKLADVMPRFFNGDTESEISVDEVIPFEKKEIDDENLEIGKKETKQEGVNGRKKIVFRVTMDSEGNVINRTVLREEIVSEPTDEIILIGKKEYGSASEAGGNYSAQTPYSSNDYSQNQQGNNDKSSESVPQSSGSNDTDPIRFCKRMWPYGTRENPYIVYYMVRTTQSCQEYIGRWDVDGRSYTEVTSEEFYSADFVSSGPIVLGFNCTILESRQKQCPNWYNGGIEACSGN